MEPRLAGQVEKISASHTTVLWNASNASGAAGMRQKFHDCGKSDAMNCSTV